MSLSIFTVYGNPRYTYRPAITRFTQDGRIGEQDSGYRFRAHVRYGKMLDPDTGDVVVGIRRPGLAQSSKARRNRAFSEIILDKAVMEMRANGYPDMTAREILDWWLTKHGKTKGIDWNVYYTDSGALVSDDDLLYEKPKPIQEAPNVVPAVKVDDSTFMVRDPETNRWICNACGWGPISKGVAGHRRSKKHVANVERLLKEQTPASAIA
jgi:hypothetical protein